MFSFPVRIAFVIKVPKDLPKGSPPDRSSVLSVFVETERSPKLSSIGDSFRESPVELEDIRALRFAAICSRMETRIGVLGDAGVVTVALSLPWLKVWLLTGVLGDDDRADADILAIEAALRTTGTLKLDDADDDEAEGL
jgi:hypothetical protein